jgi:hypothetical protein
MIKQTIKSVAVAAALVSASGVSAQFAEYYPAPRSALSTETLTWEAGPWIRATLETGLTSATLSTVVWPAFDVPHSLDIQMYCAHDTFAQNGEAFSVDDLEDTVECPDDNIIQKVDATVIIEPPSEN